MKSKKPFDFANFDFEEATRQSKQREEKVGFGVFLLSLSGWVLFKVCVITPLFIGIYYFGEGWVILTGWTLLIILSVILSYVFERRT